MDGDDSIYGDHSGLPSAVIGGNDTLDGGAGDDFLEGGGGHDTLIGGKDTDDQYGEDGDDTFLIESPDDYTPDEIIDGGPGNDRLRFTSQVGGQTLVLRSSLAGVEFVEVSDSGGDASGTMALNIDGSSVGYGLDIRGNAGANILTGTDFADTLTGGEGVDSLIGGDGDDTLYLRYDFPVEDGEVLDGGDGNDTLHMYVAMYQDFRGAEINSVEALFFQPDSSYGMKALFNADQFLFESVKATGHNYPVLVSVFMEDLTALDLSTLTGLDTLNNPGDGFEVTGDGDSETITGSILADTLGGNSGSDIFLIRAPGDHPATEAIDGGAGTDRIRFTSATEGQTLVLSSLVTNVEVAEISNAVGNASSTVALNLDASALGSGLQFFGNAGANTLTGTGFGDAMDGYTGADILLGGVGDDALTGGEGGDFLDGGKDDDTLYGNEGVDTLIGGLGNDMLDGGAVDDPATQGNFLLGGDGDDTYLVRNTFDLVDEGYVFANAGFGGNDTVVSSANWFWDVYGIGETIQIAEDADDPTGAGTTIVGGVFDNVLVGNAATNILFGRGGSDTYRAGDGVEFISLNLLGVPTSLYSGVDGHNTIVVEQRKTGPVSYDIVFDFDPTRDKANVSDYTAVNGFVTGADVMARAVNDGAGNCYIALGDGLDYLYMVGLETDDLNAADFIV